MLTSERLRREVELIRARGSASVAELARHTGVSEWSVRRDLATLAGEGRIQRVHGGARVDEPLAPVRVPDPSSAKAAIAAAASERIVEGSTVLLLAGSTVEALLPHLRRRRLTVVTNSLDVAIGLRTAPHLDLVLLGGYLHADGGTLVGPLSQAAMADLHVDLIVAGAFGVHPEVGVTGTKIVQAGYHHGMLRHGDGLMVLADATKLGRTGPTVLAEIADLHTLITDDAAPTEIVRRLREADIDVVVTTQAAGT